MNRAARLWYGIRRRCNPESEYVKESPTYAGCINGFSSLSEFSQWASGQPGFYRKDAFGKWWHLDKDLLVPGNKVYSSSTCIFVPAKINTLLGACNSTRGNWPLGVYLDARRNKWKAQCSDGGGKSKHIGYFTCPIAAHQAWQKYKSEIVMHFALNDQEVALDESLKAALIRISESIMNDMLNGRETLAMTESPTAKKEG